MSTATRRTGRERRQLFLEALAASAPGHDDIVQFGARWMEQNFEAATLRFCQGGWNSLGDALGGNNAQVRG